MIDLMMTINGVPRRHDGADVFLPLAALLRDQLRLPGTKIACGEGACGACTVLVGTPHGATLRYQTLNSCLVPVFQVAGCHVVTVEGVSDGKALSAVQEALVAGHGAQCGFCTPGMVMTLTGFCEDARPPQDLPEALCGNLCRCTGYLPILESARAISRQNYQSLAELYPEAEIIAALAEQRRAAVEISADGHQVFLPTSMEEAARWLRSHPEAVIVGGSTELGVRWAEGGSLPACLLSLAFVTAGAQVRCENDTLLMDAAATWTQIEAEARTCFPALARLLARFAGPQIKNAGTIGGQIAQASPIGDALPLLAVMDAQVEIVHAEGRRTVSISAFLDPSQSPLHAGEIVSRVRLPLPAPGQLLRLEKVSRRHGFDRSVVSAALRVALSGDNHIQDVKLAFGGIAPCVCRTPRTEAVLVGKSLTEDILLAAGDVLRTEIAPPDDARGGAEYRRLLAANLLLRLLDGEDDK